MSSSSVLGVACGSSGSSVLERAAVGGGVVRWELGAVVGPLGERDAELRHALRKVALERDGGGVVLVARVGVERLAVVDHELHVVEERRRAVAVDLVVQAPLDERQVARRLDHVEVARHEARVDGLQERPRALAAPADAVQQVAHLGRPPPPQVVCADLAPAAAAAAPAICGADGDADVLAAVAAVALGAGREQERGDGGDAAREERVERLALGLEHLGHAEEARDVAVDLAVHERALLVRLDVAAPDALGQVDARREALVRKVRHRGRVRKDEHVVDALLPDDLLHVVHHVRPVAVSPLLVRHHAEHNLHKAARRKRPEADPARHAPVLHHQQAPVVVARVKHNPPDVRLRHLRQQLAHQLRKRRQQRPHLPRAHRPRARPPRVRRRVAHHHVRQRHRLAHKAVQLHHHPSLPLLPPRVLVPRQDPRHALRRRARRPCSLLRRPGLLRAVRHSLRRSVQHCSFRCQCRKPFFFSSFTIKGGKASPPTSDFSPTVNWCREVVETARVFLNQPSNPHCESPGLLCVICQARVVQMFVGKFESRCEKSGKLVKSWSWLNEALALCVKLKKVSMRHSYVRQKLNEARLFMKTLKLSRCTSSSSISSC